MAAACNYLFTVYHHPPPSVSDIIKAVEQPSSMNDRITTYLGMKLENKTEKDKSNTGQRVHLELYFG